MPNTGFRGEVIQISDVEIKGRGTGASVRYRVLFSDTEGHVHAHTAHELQIGEDSPFTEPARLLLEACKAHAEQIHFENPGTTTEKKLRGIVESASDATEDPGEPG